MACGSDNGNDNGEAPTIVPPIETEAPAPDETPTAAPQPDEPTGIPSISLERVFDDASFVMSTGMHQAPDGTWLVLERDGLIHAVDDEASEPRIWLDLLDQIDAGAPEMGLLGFAFAPDYDTSGTFYVHYTVGSPDRSVISRFSTTADGSEGDIESEQVLMEVDQPFQNHNGGEIAFGPDGYLYIALGDGGSANDPQEHGQDLGTLLGAILRIDVAGGEEGYAIPSDNPFVDDPNALDEIWAYGLRNPWRFSFDSVTAELWAADVGQDSREEINIVERGGNYGWRIMEGFECRGGGLDCDTEGFEPPIFDYPTAGGNCAITGGFVYRGEAIPALYGVYVYSDFCSGAIWGLRKDGMEYTEQGLMLDSGLMVSTLAQGNDGEIYVLEYGNGGVFRLAP